VELPEYFPPGPDNPMGMLALRTGFPGIYIHGTNRPWGVGMRTSHGCIHLYPEDAAELFPLVQVGTPVRVINEPLVAGNDRGRLVMASFEPVEEYPQAAAAEYRVFQAIQAFLPAGATETGLGLIDWARIERLIATPQPVPIAVTRDQPDVHHRLGSLAAEPYDEPPYGSDANDARVPAPRSPAD
jgi:L,D-transpeptidase ErfK/SrfK